MAQQPQTGLDKFRAAHASLLAWLHAQSKAAHWGVCNEEFCSTLYRSAMRHFGEKLPASDTLEVFLRGLHLEDLALACALRQGSESAWEEFVAHYRSLLYSAARAIVSTAGEARARELADSLYADLYGIKTAAGEPRHPLLDHFHGRSKLSTWLRAVLAQRHVDILRAASRTESLDESGSGEAEAATVRRAASPAAVPLDDPERNRLLPRLQGAVSQALAALAPADRLLLSLYYVQHLTLAQIAKLRGVHEATASRHLARIARELREAVEGALLHGTPSQNGASAQSALSPAQIELCFDYALQDWPLDLSHELQAANHRPPKQPGTEWVIE